MERGKPIVASLFPLLAAFGVERVVCSPGSRNAALLQSAEHCEALEKYVVVDERSAAFMALGMATVSGKPVALVCTSGSALLNYAPALAEAYYQGVPLVVISADRPSEWIDQDDSQTIRQPGALSHCVKATYDLDGDSREDNYLWYANRVINEGMLKALAPKEGPVHFNIHLDGRVEKISRGKDFHNPRKVELLQPPSRIANEDLKRLAEFAKEKKIMVTAGFMAPDNRLQKGMRLLADLPNVCVMAETVSNLHLHADCYRVDVPLFRLDKKECEELRPDIIISMGGALISRQLKEFLRSCEGASHWSLSRADNLIDCFQQLTVKIECSPSAFAGTFAKFLKRLQNSKGETTIPSYRAEWTAVRKKYERTISGLPWCDLKALKVIFDRLPSETNLFLSNGTSVRYGQIIPYRLTHATYSNRGVSGIEGATSTAIGGSIVYGGLTCLITGDMSFGYDVNALASEMAGSNMRIIVIDNGGGDIFRFIPGTKDLEIRETYLCADRKTPIEGLAAAYQWEYFEASDEKTLGKELREFFAPSLRPAILHVKTRSAGEDNSKILRRHLSGK